jgi:NAD(P)-dependent dehydrogenase (short-subunit alcohol dehydrogenase family)
MQDTVLILGARGRFGLAAARAFCDAGWRVIG